VNKPKILNEYLRSLKNFVISLDFFRDKSKVLSALKISGSVKRTNVSLLSEEALHLSFGGKEKFINFADSLMPESQKIYELLCEISGGGCKR
jgi:hypothetical protein